MSNKQQIAKKLYERFLLDTFLASAKISAEVVDDEKEEPDMLIRVRRQLIGVELTEVFIDNPKSAGEFVSQARESIARRILAKANQIYLDSGASHGHVFVRFCPSADLRRLNREEIAVRLAAAVREQSVIPDQYVQWSPSNVRDALTGVVSCVYMLGTFESVAAHWTSPTDGWYVPMTREILQAQVDKKAELLPKYQERVTANWLVLVSGGAKSSQFFDVPTQSEAASVTSPFDRTFYFSRFENVVVELGTWIQGG